MTIKIRPVSFIEQLPSEIFEIILSFCRRNELFNLLTVCSQFLPIVAKKLWSMQFLSRKETENILDSKDYRVGLFFRKSFVSKLPSSAPSLPYLNYITELYFPYDFTQKSAVLILKHVPNCIKLIITWSEAIATALLDTLNTVPLLTYLKLFSTYESMESKKATKQLQAILEARAETLKSLYLMGDYFCISQILCTIASKTKLIEFDGTTDGLVSDIKCTILPKPLFPKSSWLHCLSINLSSLHPPLELDFFDWIHSSPYLTILRISFSPEDFYPEETEFKPHDMVNLFFHFLKTFPTSTPLKKLVIDYSLCDADFYKAPNLIGQTPMELNSSLETLFFKFGLIDEIVSYNLLNFMIGKFPHLKCLQVFDRDPDHAYFHSYENGSLADHQSFFNQLITLNLVKLRIDMPNSIQRFLLSSLICMTSLKDLDLRLNLDLVYPYIIELTHVLHFIFRPIEHLEDLQVLIDEKPIPLIRHKDDGDLTYYIFNKYQLDLIRKAPFESVSFVSIGD